MHYSTSRPWLRIFYTLTVALSTLAPSQGHAKVLIDPTTNCALTVPDDYTSKSIRWAGECKDGIVSGYGKIDWYGDEGLDWRTFISSDTPLTVVNGKLENNFSKDDFYFFCEANYNYRGTYVIPKSNIREDYFAEWLPAMTILQWAGEYAATECAHPDGYENINIEVISEPRSRDSLGNGFRSLLHARNYPGDRLDWFAPGSEYSNWAADAIWREVQQEAAQMAAQQAQAERARQQANMQRQFDDEMNAIRAGVGNFWETKRGDLEVLATAMEMDLARTLSLLEGGADIIGFSNQKISTVEKDRITYYAVSGFAQSRTLLLRQRFENQAGFSWENFMGQSGGSAFNIAQFTCLYRNVNEIPTLGLSTKVRLEGIRAGSVKTDVTLICG